MAATISVVDNHDGTVTYSWSDFTNPANTLLQIRRYVITGPGSSAFVANDVASGTFPAGNSTVAIPNGLYFAFGQAGVFSLPGLSLRETSNGLTFRVDDGELAIETRCRNAIIDIIKLLAIPEIGDNVHSHLVESIAQLENLPAVICTELGVQETDEQMLSTRDDVGYPVRVGIFDRASNWDHDKLPNYEMWRERMMKAFRNQQLDAVPESVNCKIEPYVIADPDKEKYEFFVSGFVVRCVCRQSRGVT